MAPCSCLSVGVGHVWAVSYYWNHLQRTEISLRLKYKLEIHVFEYQSQSVLTMFLWVMKCVETLGIFLSKDLLKLVTNNWIFVGSLCYLTAILLIFILWKCLRFFQVRNSFWENIFSSPLFWEVIWPVSFTWKPFRGVYICRMFTSLCCRLEFILVFHTRVQPLQDQEQRILQCLHVFP